LSKQFNKTISNALSMINQADKVVGPDKATKRLDLDRLDSLRMAKPRAEKLRQTSKPQQATKK